MNKIFTFYRSHFLGLCTFLLLILPLSFASAQKLDMDKLKGMKARSIGPAGMSGRVTAIDVVNDQPDIMYVGTASGGVWKSESGGIAWKPIFEKEAVASIGALAIQQNNPDVIWAGTGEGNPRNSLTGGYGIYKSLDGGKNWNLMGLEKTRNIHRIIIDKNNPNTVYVAAIGSPWGEHPERGVFKTTDGGKTWTKSLYVNEKTGCADLVVDPSNPNKLIASMWEHRRKPWTFNSGGAGSGMYITLDGGETWTKKTEKDGLPKGELGRIGLAIAPSQSKIIYALIESKKNALYKTTDGGFKWTKVSEKSNEIGNRPFYYSDIFVDPKNENRLYTIYTYVNVSEDGGKNFSRLIKTYGTSEGVHPDHHAWWIHPENPNFMIDGNDGGLNITRDRGKTWRFVENLPVAQYYHINVDNDFPYNVYGGMQDNGSWVGPAYVLKSQGIRNSYWQELMFGDGFDVIPDPENSRYGYGMSQQGYVGRYDRETGSAKFIQPTHPDVDVILRFNWNAAIAMDPFDNSTLYFGSQFVHKTTDKGHTWDVISGDLTTNDPEKLKQHESGGITMDATGAENHCTILAITPSTIQKDLLWVTTDDGKVHISKNGGEAWEDLTANVSGLPKGSWICQVKASVHDAAEAVIVVNNYRNFDFNTYLFRTKDFGKTWTSLASNTKVSGYSLSFMQDLVEPKLMFLGTEFGLYVSIDEGNVWTKWTNGYPTVSTMDLTIQPREHDLVIGTFGRAAYVLDDIRPLRALAKEGVAILDKTLKIYEPPLAYMTQNQEPSGTRFAANAIFNGENRRRGAAITYTLNKPKKDKDEEKDAEESKEEDKKDEVSFDSLTLEVFNAQNKLIRTIKQKAPEENGLSKIYWRMDEKGVFGPSRNKRKETVSEPSGANVLPGIYKLRLSSGDQMDSTQITVGYDLRLPMPTEVLKAQYDLVKEVESLIGLAGDATQRLLEAREIVDGYTEQMTKIDKEAFKDQIKEHKAMKDSINILIDTVLGKEDKRQGITAYEKPITMDYLYKAETYAYELRQMPGATEARLLKQAKDKLNPVIDQIDSFFEKDWVEYHKSVETLKLSPFKDYKSLKKE